ncbi:MAG: NADPH-dependent FMN reductase [Alphaproteobacteria bacterium]
MSEFKTVIIVGSLRKDSINMKLAKALKKLGEGKFKAEILSIDLPLYNQDLETNFPAPAAAFKNAIIAADGVLIVTPEYNRSVPGPLKNAIDWASRPYGKNAFAGKPTAIIGTSSGAIGSACAQQALKPILNYLDVSLMGQPEAYVQFKDGMIDAEGTITAEATQKFLGSYVDKFVAWVGKNSSSSAKAA